MKPDDLTVRVAERFLKEGASRTDLQQMAEEVLQTRVRGKHVNGSITDMIDNLLREAQDVHGRVEEAIKIVEGYYPPDRVDRKLLAQEIRKVIEHKWGRDAMLPFLTRMTLGDFIY